MAAESEELRFELFPGFTLAAKAWGAKDAPLKILALHGFLDSAATFDLLVPRILRSLPARVIAPDLVGHGHSSHLAPPAVYGLDTHLFALQALLRKLGWEHVVLLAHSFGGVLSTLMAAAQPELVRQMVLIDNLGLWWTAAEALPSAFISGLERSARLLGKRSRNAASMEEAVARMVKAMPTAISEDAVRILIARGSRPASDGSLEWLHDVRVRAGTHRMTKIQATSWLEEVKETDPDLTVVVPSSGLVAHGLGYPDHFIDHGMKVLQPTLLHCEGAHHVHLDDPDAVAQLIIPVLQRALLPRSKL